MGRDGGHTQRCRAWTCRTCGVYGGVQEGAGWTRPGRRSGPETWHAVGNGSLGSGWERPRGGGGGGWRESLGCREQG